MTLNDVVLAADVRRAAALAGRARRASLGLAGRRRPGGSGRRRRRPAAGRQQRLQHVHHAGDRRRRPGRAAAPDLGDCTARQGDEAAPRHRCWPSWTQFTPPSLIALGTRLYSRPGGAASTPRRSRRSCRTSPARGADQHRRRAVGRRVQRRAAGRRHRAQRHGLVVRRPDELLAARVPRPAARTSTSWRRTSRPRSPNCSGPEPGAAASTSRTTDQRRPESA